MTANLLRFIPAEYRPPIWVRVLPTLENILYGANLSNILSAHQHVMLDVLAWLPYGIGHFGAPFVCAIAIFIWGPPGTLRVYARAFGYMSALGVAINLVFPCSPPWYENMYGLAPANYKVQGSAAGLERIDKLLGVDLYTSAFKGSPQVFGAFPSLHAGDATLEALFLGHVFPDLFPFFICYVLWLWWATMYLSHHYAVDLAAGSLSECLPLSPGFHNPKKQNLTRDLSQWPASSSTSPAQSSYLGCSRIRSSAGTTTTSRSASLVTGTRTTATPATV